MAKDDGNLGGWEVRRNKFVGIQRTDTSYTERALPSSRNSMKTKNEIYWKSITE
jgi:hypothetical protein